jgi:valyl-tRNA synthetase
MSFLFRPSDVPDKPALDGLEDKWSRRWDKERVVQV